MDDYVNDRRGPLETALGLLLVLDDYQGSMKVTHIMYRLNSTVAQLEKYMAVLKRHGLIEGIKNSRYRRINLTQRGRDAVQAIMALNEYILFVEYEPPVKRRIAHLRECEVPRDLYRPASEYEMKREHALEVETPVPLMQRIGGRWQTRPNLTGLERNPS